MIKKLNQSDDYCRGKIISKRFFKLSLNIAVLFCMVLIELILRIFFKKRFKNKFIRRIPTKLTIVYGATNPNDHNNSTVIFKT